MEERKRVTTQRRCLSNSYASPSLRVSEHSVVNSSKYQLPPKVALKSSSWFFDPGQRLFYASLRKDFSIEL